LFIAAEGKSSSSHYDTINGWYAATVDRTNIPKFLKDPTLSLKFLNPNVVYNLFHFATLEGYVDTNEFNLAGSPTNLSTSAWYFTGDYTFRQYMESGDIAASTVDFDVKITDFGKQIGIAVNDTKYTEAVMWGFDSSGKILKYDGIMGTDGFLSQIGTNYSDVNFVNGLVNAICQEASALCTPENSGYTSVSDCVSFLHTLPIGDQGSANRNNLFCRADWLQILPNRPSVHCPTIGRTGGKRCLDSNNYDNDYTNDPFPVGTFQGYPLSDRAEGASNTQGSGGGNAPLVYGVGAGALVVGLSVGFLAAFVVSRKRNPNHA